MEKKVFEKVLKRADMSQFFSFNFTLDEPCNGLTVEFSYTPKYLMDAYENMRLIREAYAKYAPYLEGFEQKERGHRLSNHISLSLDAPTGHVGTAHRADNVQQFEFSQGSASPGFSPFDITAGEYVITLAANSIVCDTGVHVAISTH